jgi:hypothetical protein
MGPNVLGEENVHIGESAVVKPTVVIDAEGGPVWIERRRYHTAPFLR